MSQIIFLLFLSEEVSIDLRCVPCSVDKELLTWKEALLPDTTIQVLGDKF